MEKRIVIYQKASEVPSRIKLQRMSNSERKKLHRRTYLFTVKIEDEKVVGNFKVASCSPTDQFSRKEGLRIASEKSENLPFTCEIEQLRGLMTTFVHYFESGKGTSLTGLANSVLNQ